MRFQSPADQEYIISAVGTFALVCRLDRSANFIINITSLVANTKSRRTRNTRLMYIGGAVRSHPIPHSQKTYTHVAGSTT